MNLSDDINTVKREIARRRRTYAASIQNRVLSQQTADLEIASFESVLARLESLVAIYPACPHGHGSWKDCSICCASDKNAE